jgi:protein-tyrosine phosphatase
VDLSAEFPRTGRGLPGKAYWCVPILDASVPDEHALAALLNQIRTWPGGVFVHCASGHGRSALVGAAVLIARGLANGSRQAEERLRKARPGIHLNRNQRAFLRRFAEHS